MATFPVVELTVGNVSVEARPGVLKIVVQHFDAEASKGSGIAWLTVHGAESVELAAALRVVLGLLDPKGGGR